MRELIPTDDNLDEHQVMFKSMKLSDSAILAAWKALVLHNIRRDSLKEVGKKASTRRYQERVVKYMGFARWARDGMPIDVRAILTAESPELMHAYDSICNPSDREYSVAS